MNLSLRLVLPALSLATATLSLYANTAGFIVPSFRGQPGSEFGLWDNPNNFTVAYSASLSAPGNIVNADGAADPLGNGNSDAVIRQLAGTGMEAFTIGGDVGNIYSPTIATQFVLSDANTSTVGTVIFQVRTVGNELDYAGVKLTYDLGAGIQEVTSTRAEVSRIAAGPGGFGVSSKWEFDLTGLGVQDYSIVFNASGTSMSLDSVALDTHAAVPEPETYALCAGATLIGFALWRRRNGNA